MIFLKRLLISIQILGRHVNRGTTWVRNNICYIVYIVYCLTRPMLRVREAFTPKMLLIRLHPKAKESNMYIFLILCIFYRYEHYGRQGRYVLYGQIVKTYKIIYNNYIFLKLKVKLFFVWVIYEVRIKSFVFYRISTYANNHFNH